MRMKDHKHILRLLGAYYHFPISTEFRKIQSNPSNKARHGLSLFNRFMFYFVQKKIAGPIAPSIGTAYPFFYYLCLSHPRLTVDQLIIAIRYT